jgi:4-amino-4-deoxy-L-arabinose transferase-like glycosyltransferase
MIPTDGGQRPLRLWALALWVLLLWGVQYARRDFWEPDEARFVYVAREMRDTGEWLVPHRHGLPYADKPPLMFWLINAGETVVGPVSVRLGARLPSFLGVLAALWAVHGLGTLWRGAATGRRAVAVLSTSWLFWQVGGMGQIDALLTGLELSAVHLLVRNDREYRPWRPWAAFLLMGLAVLAKGPVGFVVPLGIYLAATLAGGDRPTLRPWQWAGGVALALAVPVAWVVACWLQGAPESYLRELLFTQNVSRAAGQLGHRQSPLYFVGHAPLSFLPWTLFVPLAVGSLTMTDRVLRRRLTGWFLFVVILFSLSVSKRHLYILSAYPAAALGVAAAWDDIEASRVCRRIAVALLCAAVVGAVATALVLAFPVVVTWVGSKPEHAGTLRGLAAWPFALTALPAVIGLWWFTGRRRERWLSGYAIALATTLAVAGGTVFPAFNGIKTPGPIRGIVDGHDPEGGRLLLFDMRGEILALNAGRRGERLNTDEDMRTAMAREGLGVAVFMEKDATDLEARFAGVTDRGHFHMGSKGVVWCAFDQTSRKPHAPPNSR